ncbi:hypothetical protein ELE36_19870 [Pseudolysobacter antarcticus]|uniref:DUF3887 domain-containing protein n=1 Tax=Pseudolysobacter antarcticus TaxID=2511995 RepID=A0A411HPL5_9GAMM|nr:hypothetical protein [Pseudolysobacter antarcticus]QBB72441.1 hypothetical protein ELE36_19870 [Pseudolysobacter antarcticus]
MSKILRYALFAISIAASVVASANPDRFPALEKLPAEPRAAVATLMDWQRTLVDLTVAEIEARFGKPDKTKNVGTNAASGKPMQMISYRLSRRSELQITIHEGEVIAVATILLPSGNESGPIED